jgi:hypothetical protein
LNAGGTREKRRSERVNLSVPVIVITETRDREQVQEEARTVSVNAHGGLFKLKMEVLAGQPMILVNPRTNMEQSCRVVRVEELPSGGYAVAFEFDHPAPGFWPVTFPPADWQTSPAGALHPQQPGRGN